MPDSGLGGVGGAATGARLGLTYGLAFGPDGSLYVADFGKHRVRRIGPDGLIRAFAGSGVKGFSGDGGAATLAALDSPTGIAVDAAGNVYVADTSNRRIRKIDTAGVISTFAGNGEAGFGSDNVSAILASFNEPTALAVDAAGNLFVADASAKRIRKISNGVISTVAGLGLTPDSGDGGPAIQAGFLYPAGLTVDSLGNVLVADQGSGRIRRINSDGVISTIAGGVACSASSNALQNCIAPGRIHADSAGSVFVTEPSKHRVVRISETGTMSVWAGTGVAGFSGDGESAASATFNVPMAIVGRPNGDVLISDSENYRIRKISLGNAVPGAPTIQSATRASGVVRVTFAKPASIGDAVVLDYTATCGSISGTANASPILISDGSTSGPASCVVIARNAFGPSQASDAATVYIGMARSPLSNAPIVTIAGTGEPAIGQPGNAIERQVGAPGGLAVDQSGRVYFSESTSDIIRMIDKAGLLSNVAGRSSMRGFTGDGGLASAAMLAGPLGLALDTNGALYFADSANYVYRRVGTDGVISTVAGTGMPGSSPSGTPARQTVFFNTSGVAFDSLGRLMLSGGKPFSYSRIESDGRVVTFAGGADSGFSGDGGPAADARFFGSSGMAMDASGNVYLTDQGNHRIRKVTPEGIVTTIAGNGQAGQCTAEGIAVEVCIGDIAAIAADADGRVYFSDPTSHVIRMVDIDGSISTIAGTGSAGFSGEGGPAGDAKFNVPSHVALDGSGNLYVSDLLNNRIRKIVLNGTIPSKPLGVFVSPGVASLLIWFDWPESNGGAPITSFEVRCGDKFVTTTYSPVLVEGLPGDTSFRCSVKAKNHFGAGGEEWSAIVRTFVDAPIAPVILSAEAGDTVVTLQFSASPINQVGSPYYIATCNPGAIQVASGSTPIIVDGLTNGTPYTCTVQAQNMSGIGPASAPITATPIAGVPLQLKKASSVKFHGERGWHELPIDRTAPLEGNITVEPRAIGGLAHNLVLEFNGPITLSGAAQYVDSKGLHFSSEFPLKVSNKVVLRLYGFPAASRVGVSLDGVNGMLSTQFSIGFLMGKATPGAIGGVADLARTRRHLGQRVDYSNFLYDINLSGSISAADLLAVKAKQGSSLP